MTQFYPGNTVTCGGDREIGVLSRRLIVLIVKDNLSMTF